MAAKQNGKQGKISLTARQKEVYEFLKDKILNRGYGPTVREIGARFGITSPNGVMCHLKALEKKGLIIREPNMSRAIQLTHSVRQRLSLPLAGMIAAGKPLLAEEQNEKIDFRGLFDGEEHFCMKVTGNALANEQLADGDHIVVRNQDNCRNGDIIVARVGGDQTVLARFRRGKGGTRLEPVDGKSEVPDPHDIEVVGVVIGMLRRV